MSLDMNSYFASVEQQLRPELRGRPVGVAPVIAESTCCIAASYEAKAYGVRTGTRVSDARRFCPEIEIVEARPEVYVRVHEEIVAAADTVLPVHEVTSIDEMFFRLGAREREPEAALTAGRRVKEEIRTRVGEFLLCSVGLAPNRFLAKIAGKMHKPDGLTVLTRGDLPHGLYPLALRDLTGIGPRMHARVRRHGVYTVEQLCALSKDRMRSLWRGVVGERWWYALRGHDLPPRPTRRRTVGHSHVLPPEFRTPEGAKAVLVRLAHKAAARLRRLGYWAGGLAVRISYAGGRKWKSAASLELCQDTQTVVQNLSSLWRERPIGGNPLKVSVVLYDLIPDSSVTPPLFVEDPRRAEITRAMDSINARFGRDSVYLAAMHRSLHTAPTRIAFTHIPDLEAGPKPAAHRSPVPTA